jgi:alginate O-acetyltransferase complex protein AlgI
MFLGGLWHGANFTFIVWGLYWGGLLVIYHLIGTHWDRFALRGPLTFLLAIIGWVVFRATDLGMASGMLAKMSLGGSGGMPQDWVLFLAFTGLATLWAIWGPNVFEFHKDRPVSIPGPAMGVIVGVILALIASARASPFLYFQF